MALLYLGYMNCKIILILILVICDKKICIAQNALEGDSSTFLISIRIDDQPSIIAYDSLKINLVGPLQTINTIAVTTDTLRVPGLDSFQLRISYKQWYFSAFIELHNSRVKTHAFDIRLYTKEGVRNYLVEMNNGVMSKKFRRMKDLKILYYGIDNFGFESVGSSTRIIQTSNKREMLALKRYEKWVERNSYHKR